MKQKETDELQEDILDAFKELGTTGGEKEEIPNIYWYSWVLNPAYDRQYLQDENKQFSGPFPIIALCLGQTTKEEMDILGINLDKCEKLYVTGNQFSKHTLVVKKSDRYIHRGVKYEVVHFKPVTIAEQDIFYTIYGKEAVMVAQEEEYREINDPTFEVDQDKEYIDEEVIDIRKDRFTEFTARVLGTAFGPFDIQGGVNNKLNIIVNGGIPINIVIPEDNYTVAELADELNNQFSAFNDILVAEVSSNVLMIKMLTYSEGYGFDILRDTQSVCPSLGIDIGRYMSYRGVVK